MKHLPVNGGWVGKLIKLELGVKVGPCPTLIHGRFGRGTREHGLHVLMFLALRLIEKLHGGWRHEHVDAEHSENPRGHRLQMTSTSHGIVSSAVIPLRTKNDQHVGLCLYMSVLRSTCDAHGC